MVFNSFTFLLFFLIVLAVHGLPINWTIKKLNLLVASYLFYAAWNPPFVLLLIGATIIDFLLARIVFATKSPVRRKLAVACSVVINLGLLGFFKYGGFLLDNFTQALAWAGIQYHAAPLDLILPLGISFYTFETISYLVDVYKGKCAPAKSFLDYALFLTFFPHLVAGPIVRAGDFLPQLQQPRRASWPQMGWGLSLMLLGLFQKTFLADVVLAGAADKVFSAKGAAIGTLDAWLGTIAFAGQIFFDFAGYSSCGIGAALCLGFVLKSNFRFPYAALGFSDFWRRWHISLSSWLRDYLYIPLGGNRGSGFRCNFNLLLTMLLGGLWHGASWTFVVWGGLHGLYLIVERGLRKWYGQRAIFDSSLGQIVIMLATYVAVLITWVFFRATTFDSAFAMLRAMIHADANPLSILRPVEVANIVGLTAALLACHWLLRDSSLEELCQRIPWWLRSVCLAVFCLTILLVPGEDRAFIYFQF
jgi:D-alanyl-lipoteichoic acid acyltransferase DltB (MBOAT superfamily)